MVTIMDVMREMEQGQEDWAFSVGVQAYVWGYPIVECWRDRLKKMGVEPRLAGESGGAPVLNAFRHVRALSTPESDEFVNSATDFLYSTAVLDLRGGPLKLETPDFDGRWYVLQVLDPYMETIANLGTRTFGARVPPVVIVNDQAPSVPASTQVIRGGSDYLYVVARIAVDPQEDMRQVHRLQDGLRLGHLDPSSQSAAFANGGREALPSPDVYRPFGADPPDFPEGLSFFRELGSVIGAVPPRPDEGMLGALLGEIGFRPGLGFDPHALSPAAQRGLAKAVPFARAILDRKVYEAGRSINGWGLVKDIGNYDKNYVVRALVAKLGIWANVPEESMYFICMSDHEGQLLHGRNRYEIRFAAGGTPPVDAFWSITSYDHAGRLSANALHKPSIHSQYSALQHGPDGSLALSIGGSAGDGPPSNWLPAHDGPFTLTFRCYNPRAELLSLDYRIPPVARLV
jgi:hypothetical protein